MGKNKLKHFAEMLLFSNVVQLDRRHRGAWNEALGNTNPITLEIGCGKGEYTVGLARRYPERNFIGVDVKGARIYTGAKRALESNLNNVMFLRAQADHLPEYFAPGEVGEIWITFADPHPPLSRARRRLTSPKYIDVYRQFMPPNGLVHLKTDDDGLYQYTLEVIEQLNLNLLCNVGDVHHTDHGDDRLNILTYYERMHLAKGKTVKYVRFGL
ncbi:MAG TPA: tRNA (guanosine(46)-N7)-methyltransferase TrmB [Chitinophagales bacterium]|nr:tRNA (guanosine(46)-N7)-methyltransferase TrmB [Chitinophagales bacterium]